MLYLQLIIAPAELFNVESEAVAIVYSLYPLEPQINNLEES
jgi:hypothetical protein